MNKTEKALDLACEFLQNRCYQCPIRSECEEDTEDISCAEFWKKYLLEHAEKEG